ncbi:MAG: hypothetical protein DRQ42_05785 [Gammaproteobacteria bacterium]|nr:MAG: hypothetical protein DRQ42_05785 [Gammaproteobacteria bacterium]
MKILITLILSIILFTPSLAWSVCSENCFDRSTYDQIWGSKSNYDTQLEIDRNRRDIDALQTQKFEREIQQSLEPIGRPYEYDSTDTDLYY